MIYLKSLQGLEWLQSARRPWQRPWHHCLDPVEVVVVTTNIASMCFGLDQHLIAGISNSRAGHTDFNASAVRVGAAGCAQLHLDTHDHIGGAYLHACRSVALCKKAGGNVDGAIFVPLAAIRSAIGLERGLQKLCFRF